MSQYERIANFEVVITLRDRKRQLNRRILTGLLLTMVAALAAV